MKLGGVVEKQAYVVGQALLGEHLLWDLVEVIDYEQDILEFLVL